jgi:F-type H+-transporting ATPase subunit b
VPNALAAALVLASGAAEEGHAAATWIGVPIWVWQAVNLVGFLVVLVWLLKKPFRSFLDGRHAEVATALRKAEESQQRAEKLSTELAGRIARVEKDLAEIRARAEAEAGAEKAEILAKAEEEAQRIVAQAEAEMDRRVRAARAELTAHAAELAVAMAKDLLVEKLSPDDQRRLVAEGTTALSAARPGA